MIDKICQCIVGKIRKSMPEIDDERAEIILYGIQLILGEIPKMFLLFALSFILGIGWYTVITFLCLMPYRAFSGGFHLKSHIGCIVGTSVFYYGIVYLSKFITLGTIPKYVLVAIAFVFGLIMVKIYAPADTESVPIISKKERRTKKILAYITLTITLGASLLVKDVVISNILIIGVIIQTIMITRIAYKLTNNRYGYEAYKEELETAKLS